MFKWLTRSTGSLWDVQVRLRRIEAATDTIEHAVSNMNGRGAGMARKMEKLIESVNGIHHAVLKHCEAAKEDRLGPMLYDIAADDLSGLSLMDRKHVGNSGVMCFNDICATKLVNVDGCGISSIKRIMDWKRSCVMRATESQASDYLDDLERAAR
jgi:hypothetical protein